MSYCRARLLLGMTGVGTWVVLAFVLSFWTVQPAQLLCLYLSFSFVFDLLGGQMLPRFHSRPTPSLMHWLLGYSRATLVHTTILICSGCLLLLAGQFGLHWPVGLALSVLLVARQAQLSRLAGTQKVVERAVYQGQTVDVVECEQEGFSGGVAGLPGREVILLPAAWPEEVREVATARRRLIVSRGARALGVMVAISYNSLGLYLATRSGLQSLADLCQASLSMTLWSFLGLLVLPSLSRAGVLWADQETRQAVGWPAFQNYLDQMVDETLEAKPVSEPVFYPIPSYSARVAALEAHRSRLAPWYPARLALFLSMGHLSLLSRAVHCNSGRPALWFFPPCD
jgi:hypothetical protein